jgi:hypothetical protein
MSRSAFATATVVACLHAGSALAACDLPVVGPTDLPIGPAADGRSVHLVMGVVGICDVAAHSFEVDLPALRDRGPARVQLSLAGFSRRYGVRQTGFFIGRAEAAATAAGVRIDYAATIDGLERYQLAYTLYLSAAP